MNLLRWMVLVLMLNMGAGCATVPGGTPPSKQDPWESVNRKVFGFNETVDDAVLKPMAKTYVKVVPQLVRTGVSNVLGNVGDVWSAANHLLQGKVQHGLEMGMRVLTNSTFGLAGLLDPASEMGLVRRPEDFGQTLGRWGVGPGPYLVLPLMGPSTLRDGSASLLVDRRAAPSSLAGADAAAYVMALDVVDKRAGLLDLTKLLDDVALDKYSFVRDAYLVRRQNAVRDGTPSPEVFVDEPADPNPDSPAKPTAPGAPQPLKPATK
jgi:phospholipid-binding lipoprotein MlaA